MAVESGYNRAARMLSQRGLLRKMLMVGAGSGLACTLGLEMLSGCAGEDKPMAAPPRPRSGQGHNQFELDTACNAAESVFLRLLCFYTSRGW
jgi:hypothetical protein